MAFEITERWLSDIGGWKVAKPAKVLASGSAVLKASFDGRVLRGLVLEGRKRLACGLRIVSADDVTNLCSCRDARMSGAMCIHSLAAGFAFLKQSGAGGEDAGSRSEQFQDGHLKPVKTSASVLSPVLRADWVGVARAGKLVVEFEEGGVGTPTSRFQSSDDKHVADALSAIGHDRIPRSVVLGVAKAGPIFEAIVHHSRLRVGEAAVRVGEARARLCVKVTRDAGQVRFELVTEGEEVEVGKRRWWWSSPRQGSGGVLVPIEIPPELQGLVTSGSAIMPEAAFARLAEAFFDAFEVSLDSDTALIATCRGLIVVPEVIFRIEGSLRALDGWLSFAYPDGPTVELGGSSKREFPYVDHAKNRIRRNEAYEHRILGEVREMGFSIGRNALEIRGEELILRFLSNYLPGLRKRWRVTVGERFEHVSRAVALVRPTVEWEPSGGSGEDWLEFGLSYETGDGIRIPTAEIQRMVRVGTSGAGRPGAKRAIINLEAAGDWNEVMDEAGVELEGDRIRVRASQASFIASSLERMGASVPPGFVSRKAGNFHMDKRLLGLLRDYQKEGVEWIAAQGLTHGGVILGDEMGLGKTLQALAVLSGMKCVAGETAGEAFLSLVVCPASLLWNWEAEIGRFLPDFKTFVLHGTSRGKLFRKLNQCDIAITTYALAVRDAEKWGRLRLNALVLDEASYLRNPDTKVSKAVRSMCQMAGLRLALTGTPIENGVRDMWSIMECVVPGYLGARKEFQERYEKPLAGSAGLSDSDIRRLTERLNRRIRPFFLRRTKERVAKELPSKIESIQLIELSAAQTELYRGISREVSNQVQDSQRTGNSGAARMHMLTGLLRLRQVCCDPRLVTDQLGEEDSAKLAGFEQLLSRLLEDNHRVLVFSQFVEMLRILRKKMEDAGIGFCYLDGGSTDRQEQVARFQSEPGKQVFLISLKAGGYGLNLTQADVVIHYDPWWNPAVEAQATDRAHRIGQTRTVNVYKFIARSSVEEKILRLQRKKRSVIDAAIDDNQPLMRGLTDRDLTELLE